MFKWFAEINMLVLLKIIKIIVGIKDFKIKTIN